eukprot:tig00001095_g7039.t1
MAFAQAPPACWRPNRADLRGRVWSAVQSSRFFGERVKTPIFQARTQQPIVQPGVVCEQGGSLRGAKGASDEDLLELLEYEEDEFDEDDEGASIPQRPARNSRSAAGSKDSPKRARGRQLGKGRRVYTNEVKSVRSYCVATSFKMRALLSYLQQQEDMPIRVYRDVIYARRFTEGSEEDGGDVFYFPYGVIVSWGLRRSQEQRLLDEIREFAEEPVPRVQLDSMEYTYGATTRIRNDEIVLPRSPSLSEDLLDNNGWAGREWEKVVLLKLSHSHGMAQSVKLIVFEDKVQSTIRKTRYIPQVMAQTGKIKLTSKEMHRRVGEILFERHSINLHSDILDVPEFFWEYTELEPVYEITARYLDVEKRVEVLNRRLDIVRELFDLLSTELNHKYSSRLEWIIIILIVIEVILSFSKDVFHIL